MPRQERTCPEYLPKAASTRLQVHGGTQQDDHLSGLTVADEIMQPTRGSKDTDHVPPKASRLFGLAPGGVCHAPSVTGRPVSFYLAVSPVPRLRQGFGRKNPACWQKNPDFFLHRFMWDLTSIR